MNRLTVLPRYRSLLSLARAASFPISRQDMLTLARARDAAPSTVVFLRRFNPEDVFENGADFMNRCEEMKLLLRDLRDCPRELLRSPQE